MGAAIPTDINELKSLKYSEAKRLQGANKFGWANKDDAAKYLATEQDFEAWKKGYIADQAEFSKKRGASVVTGNNELAPVEEGHRQGRVREGFDAGAYDRALTQAKAQLSPDLTDERLSQVRNATSMRLRTQRGRASTFLGGPGSLLGGGE